MGRPTDVERAGARVEELLDLVRVDATPLVAGQVEELIRVLLELYGGALQRVMELVGTDGAARLAADPLLSSLLVLHDLHPDPAMVRIERALEDIRPHLGSHAGGVDLLGLDEDGTVHLRLEGTCHSCPSSAETVRGAIEGAVLGAAPEVVAVVVEGVVSPDAEAFVPLEAVGLRCPTALVT